MSKLKIEERARELLHRYRQEIGRSGGKARAEKLTPEQRSASARKAARARWKKITAAALFLLALAAPLDATTRCHTCPRDRHGRIVRNESARCAFLRQQGYTRCRVPAGMIIDHVIPLACGGRDVPANMQLQTRAAAKLKDRTERKGCTQ